MPETEEMLKYIDSATDKIVEVLEAMKGITCGKDHPGGINRLAKNICVSKYSNRCFKYAKESGVSSWDKMNSEQLKHSYNLVKTAMFFIERDEDNFIDFYDKMLMEDAAPGDRIAFCSLESGKIEIINFHDIKEAKF